MIYKLPDITQEIKVSDPFKDCVLKREPYAQVLTKIIEDAKGGVIALNGKWGTGKTTFVKMWKVYLEKNDFTCLYLNVWDNDYSVDPIIPLMAQFYELFNSKLKEKSLNDYLAKGAKVTINILKPIGKGVLKKLTGIKADEIVEGVDEALDESVEQLAKYGESIINKAIEEKKDLVAFKKELEKMVNVANEKSDKSETDNTLPKKPIVCIIDELDRCNPHYAVLVLERIKHLFSVEGIVFVLSIDKEELENSIRGYYGSDLIDSPEYLRRFFDIELKLPIPLDNKFIDYVYKSMDFENVLNNRQRINARAGKERENLGKIIKLLLSKDVPSLRMIEKYMNYLRLVLAVERPSRTIQADSIAILLYIKYLYPEFYYNISHRKYSLSELFNQIDSIFDISFFVDSNTNSINRVLAFSLTEIICSYNSSEYGQEIEPFLYQDSTNSQLKLRNIPQDLWNDIINWKKRNSFDLFPLNQVIENIELIGNMIV